MGLFSLEADFTVGSHETDFDNRKIVRFTLARSLVICGPALRKQQGLIGIQGKNYGATVWVDLVTPGRQRLPSNLFAQVRNRQRFGRAIRQERGCTLVIRRFQTVRDLKGDLRCVYDNKVVNE